MKTIGVFFGGKSPEHDISIITGELIISGLKESGHRVIPVYLDKEGKWFLGEKLGSIEFFRNPHKDFRGLGGFYLDLEHSRGKIVFQKKGLIPRKVIIDLAFPAFHGQNGEDGTVQGMFEIFNVPYVGCDVVSSAITIDKVLTKLFYERHGLSTTKFISFYGNDWKESREHVLENVKNNLRFPLFVKPARLGSSIGIARVEAADDLTRAIEVALHYDEKILVEEGIRDVMDVTCAVLGTNPPTPSLLQESVFGGALFSYDDKYLKKGGVQLGKGEEGIVIPARLDTETTEKIRSTAVSVFRLFGCSGIARVDFLYDKNSEKIYVNEVNTLPGTLYHHLWKKSGIELGELLSRLINLAEERNAKKKDIISTFDSSVLSQVAVSSKLQKKDG